MLFSTRALALVLILAWFWAGNCLAQSLSDEIFNSGVESGIVLKGKAGYPVSLASATIELHLGSYVATTLTAADGSYKLFVEQSHMDAPAIAEIFAFGHDERAVFGHGFVERPSGDENQARVGLRRSDAHLVSAAQHAEVAAQQFAGWPIADSRLACIHIRKRIVTMGRLLFCNDEALSFLPSFPRKRESILILPAQKANGFPLSRG